MDSSERVPRERSLRKAVLAGDEQAWRTWYDESFAGLYAYVLWRCAGWHNLADEIVQETWMTAVHRIRRFIPEQGSFLNWLRGIAGNLLRNHLRREDRRGRLLLARHQEAVLTAPVESDLERSDRARHIARVLTGLKDRYEAVLRAHYLEGRSVADIAAEWRETPKAIESLLTRAREAFRSAYGHSE